MYRAQVGIFVNLEQRLVPKIPKLSGDKNRVRRLHGWWIHLYTHVIPLTAPQFTNYYTDSESNPEDEFVHTRTMVTFF